MIDVGKIPTFAGNLDTLETHAAALKTTASGIRGTGRDAAPVTLTGNPGSF
ncbi:hypothetical protein [Streptomyces erythrochromogenes]|uniref:hypothetical protein n=1 Tax=Streptomyces erythrochromogenes TaxID=285574 RepID=UPI00369AA85B